MHNIQTVHTLWDDVENALREGKAPEKQEILDQLSISSPNTAKIYDMNINTNERN